MASNNANANGRSGSVQEDGRKASMDDGRGSAAGNHNPDSASPPPSTGLSTASRGPKKRRKVNHGTYNNPSL